MVSEVIPVGEPLPSLLRLLHGRAEKDIEDDEEDAGEKVHEEHSEPEESPGNSKVVGEMVFRNFWFTKGLSNLFLFGTAFQYSVFQYPCLVHGNIKKGN